MALKATLQSALKEALKARDKNKLDTIRGILSAIQYEEMERKEEPLADTGVIEILQREMKRRKEEIEFAEKANRPDLKEKVCSEMATVESFLPKQLSGNELERIVIDLKTKNGALNMGLAMKALKEGYSGQYDSKLASEVVKRILG